MAAIERMKRVLVSVFHKDGLDEILRKLHSEGASFVSTSGAQSFIESLGLPYDTVENLASCSPILGGRVKTLHPKVFGGILARRENKNDQKQLAEYEIPETDLIIVDLYPLRETVAPGAEEQTVIKKIDIGGIFPICVVTKNFKDAIIVASKAQHQPLMDLLNEKGAETGIKNRKWFAKEAFTVSSSYDSAILNYLDGREGPHFRATAGSLMHLRYGENPYQVAKFYGKFNDMSDQIHGKEIFYNNLLDIDAAVNLIDEFDELALAILKHNNAYGITSHGNVVEAWREALASDPVSAFGDILITNTTISKEVAEEISKISFEVIIAPAYDADTLEVLQQKRNCIILIRKDYKICPTQSRSLLSDALIQERNLSIQGEADLEPMTDRQPIALEARDLLFANKIVKNSKSSTITLVKDKQLCASGIGQISRADSLRQAMEKARSFSFDLNNTVMASNAFFPFPNYIEIADQASITVIIQPGGSINDKPSVRHCN